MFSCAVSILDISQAGTMRYEIEIENEGERREMRDEDERAVLRSTFLLRGMPEYVS